MDINATLFGQMITFGIFVWFTMKFVWPPLEKTLQDRQVKISEGLAAAERGHTELAIAQKYALEHIHESKQQAIEIIDRAKKQALHLIEEARKQALIERDQSRLLAQAVLEQERLMIQQNLKTEFARLLGASAEKLLTRVLTESDQKTLLEMHLEPYE